MTGTSLRRAAGAVAVVSAAALGCMLLLVAGGPLEGGLALAASVTALAALVAAPLLLPPAVALYAAGLVVAVHRAEVALWTVPLLALLLLLLYEAGELRHRLPPGFVVEAAPLGALARRLALTASLGLLASITVVAAAGLSSGGGAAAAVVGGLAVAAAVLLVGFVAAVGPTRGSDD